MFIEFNLISLDKVFKVELLVKTYNEGVLNIGLNALWSINYNYFDFN